MAQRLLAGMLTCAFVVCAQQRVDPRDTYHRVIAVVDLVGSGTATDPKRPRYAPTPGSTASSGIIAFTQVATDDGKSAIVEFVARDRKALAAILADTSIPTFEKGVASAGAIESALQKYKKGFTLAQFEVVMP